ncbi:hypothetical protein KOAAANKH_03843 [Brevundimonas sp. NIBR10]|uniref:ParB/RepB/Spo0J family partition protein n=1 Tax=Brevundimonas sp. NIBR10 TaxID=3015997 RepID=UPI0022F1B2EC|nr:plasmid partitioning protein RepB C-terminal domain-containing protein [Brevundimonas sp. NIBR10]WGM48929.1 hypothetical protein KOAAANKH_03843 [Brevundimonas sp. NIBR10]
MTRTVEMVPIEHVTVLNPRTRNRKQHREIVDNIDAVGLKRPISARRKITADGVRYEVVCGEGRLEAFRMLDQTHLPVVFVDGTEADCMVMSLVENVARRKHRSIDLIQEIGGLRKRGYSDVEIAGRIGVTASWVGMVGTLIEKGEERLVAAVESGLIPITFAIDIARAKTSEDQRLLTEAYASGQLKGKNIPSIRRMLEQRSKRNRSVPDSGLGRQPPRRVQSASELMAVYQRHAEKLRETVRKTDYAEDRFLFVVEALRKLFGDENFTNVLKAEGLDTMPRFLSDQVVSGSLS